MKSRKHAGRWGKAQKKLNQGDIVNCRIIYCISAFGSAGHVSWWLKSTVFWMKADNMFGINDEMTVMKSLYSVLFFYFLFF